MAKIPEAVRDHHLVNELRRLGIPLRHEGKVRQMFDVDDDHVLMVATDRASAYNFVLSRQAKLKGVVLTALSVYWAQLLQVPTHLVASGPEIYRYLPLGTEQRLPDLHRRALIVRRAEPLPIEAIARYLLMGSGWRAYQRDPSHVFGYDLPDGLVEGSVLPKILYTPTDKSETDDPISFDQTVELLGLDIATQVRDLTLGLLSRTNEHLATRRTVVDGVETHLGMADTKFEFGLVDGEVALIDEWFTGDSSRYFIELERQRAVAAKRSVPSWDKEGLRAQLQTIETPWGVGLHQLKGNDPQHVAFVETLADHPVLVKAVDDLGDLYLRGYELITGEPLAT